MVIKKMNIRAFSNFIRTLQAQTPNEWQSHELIVKKSRFVSVACHAESLIRVEFLLNRCDLKKSAANTDS
jgi:putative IMPACT (imprinted ancient) family translation regulator